MTKVLVLEDDYDLAKSWQSVLEAAGHMVTLVQSSSEAIQYLEDQYFGAVIADLMISVPAGDPPDSGIHVLRFLRHSKRLPKLIGVSGYYGSDSGDMAKNLLKVYGAHHVFMKPFDPEDLVDLI